MLSSIELKVWQTFLMSEKGQPSKNEIKKCKMLQKHLKIYSDHRIINNIRNKTECKMIMHICSFRTKNIKIHMVRITTEVAIWKISANNKISHLIKMPSRIRWTCRFNKTTATTNPTFRLKFRTFGMKKINKRMSIGLVLLGHLFHMTMTIKIHIVTLILLTMITNNSLI